MTACFRAGMDSTRLATCMTCACQIVLLCVTKGPRWRESTRATKATAHVHTNGKAGGDQGCKQVLLCRAVGAVASLEHAELHSTD
jgi:hypothetical protein